jgi:hypothetical protein
VGAALSLVVPCLSPRKRRFTRPSCNKEDKRLGGGGEAMPQG